jgi:hypothetical protein
MRRVIIESPYAAENDSMRGIYVDYARACLLDSLRRGEAPFASHLLYAQPGVLRDEVASERHQGIEAGLAWAIVADVTVVYVDHGISNGMQRGIDHALARGRPVEQRTLDGRAKP